MLSTVKNNREQLLNGCKLEFVKYYTPSIHDNIYIEKDLRRILENALDAQFGVELSWFDQSFVKIEIEDEFAPWGVIISKGKITFQMKGGDEK